MKWPTTPSNLTEEAELIRQTKLSRELAFARRLGARGYKPGIHVHGVVVLYNGRVWRVVGGSDVSPSLLGTDISIGEVLWVND